MMDFDPERHIGKEGYLKITKGIYVHGRITESGSSGAAGYYLLLQWHTKRGQQTRTLVEHINEVRSTCPNSATLISRR